VKSNDESNFKVTDNNSTNSHAKITEEDEHDYDNEHDQDHDTSNINDQEDLHSPET